MSRAVIYEAFGGPEVLELREVPEPHAGPGEVRVRVTAAGLNPMDWGIASRPEAAARFGIAVPAGFGSDLAGVIDEVGDGVTGFAVGDRVFGGALGRAVADFVVIKPPADSLWHTPEGIGDEVASTLPVAGLTAAAALTAIGPRPGDTVLIGGAAGGVGVFAGLADRVRALAPGGVTAATDLFGTETAETALALGVAPERISTVAAGPNPPGGVRATGAVDAVPDALRQITDAILAGELTVPIAAAFPVEKIRDAVTLQAGRHVHGKVVVTL
ncbi:alcohol dehydrogenase catalytic domain-containing protein [Microbispora sp. RL4-1S]|uniref:Alcohol dehydrogenase catalytic domain-containing protein n=1 Tax=Microbispora oryzae TaxID=2806554 RepID=A0A940WER3_9ACTN|nr:alcohol dehydrogenase catalytic domain-containing protein [Microbispora oryzae]MBP2704195.1 alcohol dehydrogenase catalytic domain-containing protein [Microbispora oryzae]